jgi:hypothetical protein
MFDEEFTRSFRDLRKKELITREKAKDIILEYFNGDIECETLLNHIYNDEDQISSTSLRLAISLYKERFEVQYQEDFKQECENMIDKIYGMKNNTQ